MARNSSGIVGGAVLVAVGVGLLFVQTVPDLGGGPLLAAIGVAFLAAAAVLRSYGLVIPGCILSGLGAGITIEELDILRGGSSVVLGLAIGFIAIWLLTVVFFRDRRSGSWWPLIPGGILAAVGVGLGFGDVERMAELAFAVGLLVLGVWILIRSFGVGSGGGTTPGV